MSQQFNPYLCYFRPDTCVSCSRIFSLCLTLCWQEKMVTINTESALTPRPLRDTRRMNMFVSVAAAVAGLLFGLDIGVIAGALPFITDHFVLTSRLQEWVVSSMMLGAAIGALFNGWLSFRLGRKYSLMAGAILFVLGSIGSAFATSVEMLIAARVERRHGLQQVELAPQHAHAEGPQRLVR